MRHYGLKDGHVIAFETRETPARGRELTFLQQLLNATPGQPAPACSRPIPAAAAASTGGGGDCLSYPHLCVRGRAATASPPPMASPRGEASRVAETKKRGL